MKLVRQTLFAMLFVFSVLLLSISICAVFWLPSRVAIYIAQAWGWSILALLHLFGIRYQIEGKLPKTSGHFIIASKHQSPWETAAFHWFFAPAVYMFKKELLLVPLAGLAMLKVGCMPVSRGSTTRKGLAKLIGRFKDRLRNRNIIMFPEGTRTMPDAPGEYKSGLGTIAAGLGTSIIVPVAHNSGRLWPRRGYPSGPGLITVRIMPAINTKGMNRNEINARVEAAIEKGMKGL